MLKGVEVNRRRLVWPKFSPASRFVAFCQESVGLNILSDWFWFDSGPKEKASCLTKQLDKSKTTSRFAASSSTGALYLSSLLHWIFLHLLRIIQAKPFVFLWVSWVWKRKGSKRISRDCFVVVDLWAAPSGAPVGTKASSVMWSATRTFLSQTVRTMVRTCCWHWCSSKNVRSWPSWHTRNTCLVHEQSFLLSPTCLSSGDWADCACHTGWSISCAQRGLQVLRCRVPLQKPPAWHNTCNPPLGAGGYMQFLLV